MSTRIAFQKLQGHYMDDLAVIFEDISKTIQIYEVHKTAEFEICSFTSNSSKVFTTLKGF